MSKSSLRVRVGFNDGDRVIAAIAESASGPGWSNHPLRVLVMSRQQQLRILWIQPDDFTREISALYSVAQSAHLSLTHSVRALLKDKSE